MLPTSRRRCRPATSRCCSATSWTGSCSRSTSESPRCGPQFAQRTVVRDFRPKNCSTSTAPSRPRPVPRSARVPERRTLTEAKLQTAVAKYGRRSPFPWEAIVNDDLDALRDTPDRLAQGRAASPRTGSRPKLYADGTGPDTAFFTGRQRQHRHRRTRCCRRGRLQTAFEPSCRRRRRRRQPDLHRPRPPPRRAAALRGRGPEHPERHRDPRPPAAAASRGDRSPRRTG